MPSRCTRNFRKPKRRNQRGSIMPMMAFALLFIFAFMSFSIDVMREVLAVQQLRFAARAAALDLLAMASLDANQKLQNNAVANSLDGSFSSQAMETMQTELGRINSTAWNKTISNIESEQPAQSAVSFESEDLQGAASTSTDKSDPYLKLTARRSGEQGMNWFFLPVRFAASFMNAGSSPEQGELRTDLVQSGEIACQPAGRIGPGAPLESSTAKGQVLANARLAAFPLALNYDDFKRAQQAAGSATFSCTVQVSNPGASQQSNASDLRAYFINLRKGGTVSDYYFDAQNPARVDDLIGLIEYFNANPTATAPLQIPAAVERSVQLDRFGSSVLGNAEVLQVLAELPTNHSYIIPVCRESASPATQCQVEGFALLKLDSVTAASTGCKFVFSMGESVPIANASCTSRLKTIPYLDGSKLPSYYDSSNNPFAPRCFDAATNTLAPRTQGVAMAPVVSPRRSYSES